MSKTNPVTVQDKLNPAPLPARFNFHEDPTDGWLQVPYMVIELLDIADEISTSSYRADDSVYLDQREDMEVFAKAYTQFVGKSAEGNGYLNSITKVRVTSKPSFIKLLPTYYKD